MRIESNLESFPSSAVMRLKRNDPSLVAQMATAALRTTCLQFQAATPPLLVKLERRLGQGGSDEPALAAAALALRVGRYKLSAVHEI